MFTTLKHKLFFILAGVILIVASLFFITLYLPAPHTTAAGADLNGYIAQYECRAGNPNCNVDVINLVAQPCDQIITTSTSPTNNWSALNQSNTVICIQVGDHRARGTLTLTASGTSGKRKILKAVKTDNNLANDPWKVSAVNRATLSKLDHMANYWLIEKLAWDGDKSVNKPVLFDNTTACSNNIIDRILVENAGGGASVTFGDDTCDNNVIQNSVLRNAKIAAGLDIVGVDIAGSFGADHTWIVNNEIYNHGAEIGHDSGSGFTNGTVIENNDVYKTSAMLTDCNGNFTPNNPDSPCMAAEAIIGFKDAGEAGEENTTRVINNRLWTSRKADLGICCNGGTNGQMMSISRYNSEASDNVFVKNNILMDGQTLIKFISPTNGSSYDYISIVGNILYNTKRFNSNVDSHAIDTGISAKANASEFYLNTIISADEHWGDKYGTNNDWLCNAVIASGKTDGSLGSNTIFNYNVYYGATHAGDSNKIDKSLSTRTNTKAYSQGTIIRTSSSPTSSCTTLNDPDCFLYQVTQAGTSANFTPSYCTTLGCTTTDGTMTIQAIRGPYAFYRKLQTNPELYIIPYAAVHSSAPEQGFCPSSTGSRSGIGINDDAVF